MTIKDYLTKIKIEVRDDGIDLTIACPDCGTLASGIIQAEFHINKENGSGKCWGCKIELSFSELAEKLGLKDKIQAVENGEIIFADVRQKHAKKEKEIATPSEPIEEPEDIVIDTSKFKPLSSVDLLEILGITIKKDDENKLITFLCQLATYTDSSQFNISFNAPSSSGKSYIPIQISRLFPKEDLMMLGACSPRAFYHDVGKYEKETNTITVDLSQKIIIFLDQPHTLLLKEFRALLSHDDKRIQAKIADKGQKGGNRTKTVIIIGFPTVIFCTASLNIDEQESTRFLLLSPETNQEKIRDAVHEKIRKEADADAYERWVESDPQRLLLKERIRAIRLAGISDVRIGCPEKIEQRFLEKYKTLKPRHSRDAGRIMNFIKAFALLNVWFRKREGSVIVATDEDINAAFALWDGIAESQDLNLPPYIYKLHCEVIVLAWKEKEAEDIDGKMQKLGLTRQEIHKKHYQVYGRYLPDWQLRQQVIVMLENAGLITQDRHPKDNRKILIYPTDPLTASTDENNCELDGGVNVELPSLS